MRRQLGFWKTNEGKFAFRVWAPHASAVSILGDFNEWDWAKNPMAPEESGYWISVVENATYTQEYRFGIVNGENQFTRIDPYAIAVTNSMGNGILSDLEFDWGSTDFHASPKNELVIYEMHIGTFNVQRKKKPATLDDCIHRIDYLAKLGINAIELMPCAEFAGDFSWGYNPAHLFAVEQAYGGPLALKRFVKAAHERGIAVIQDVVYNHFGPSDLSTWQFDGWSENGKGGIYFYNDWRSATPWGETRPDYGRPEVRDFIIDNAHYWLDEFKMDGLRFDMTLFIRHVNGDGAPGGDLPDGWSLTQAINEMVHRDFPGRITIAEDLQNNDWLTKAVGDGGAGFDLQWDAQFVHPVRKCMIAKDDIERSVDAIKSAAFAQYNGDSFQRVIFSESHDEVANGKARVPSEIDPSSPDGWYARKRSTLAAALGLTVPGVPMLFQGQELLEDEWFRDTDPIEWFRTLTFTGIHLMYRDLIALRRNLADESRGLSGPGMSVIYEHNESLILVYHRWDHGGPKDDVVVLLNLSHEVREMIPVCMPKLGRWDIRFNSDWSGYSDDFDNISLESQLDAVSTDEPLFFSLAPYSLQILVYLGNVSRQLG